MSACIAASSRRRVFECVGEELVRLAARGRALGDEGDERRPGERDAWRAARRARGRRADLLLSEQPVPRATLGRGVEERRQRPVGAADQRGGLHEGERDGDHRDDAGAVAQQGDSGQCDGEQRGLDRHEDVEARALLERRQHGEQEAERQAQPDAHEGGVAHAVAVGDEQQRREAEAGEVPARLGVQAHDVARAAAARVQLRDDDVAPQPGAEDREPGGDQHGERDGEGHQRAAAVGREQQQTEHGKQERELEADGVRGGDPGERGGPLARGEQRRAEQQPEHRHLRGQRPVLAHRPRRQQRERHGGGRRPPTARQPPHGDAAEQRRADLRQPDAQAQPLHRVADRQDARAEDEDARRLRGGHRPVEVGAVEPQPRRQRVHALGVVPVVLALPQAQQRERAEGEQQAGGQRACEGRPHPAPEATIPP